MLAPTHPHLGYSYTNDSSPTGGGGTSLAAGASANTYGSWIQIGPTNGLEYASDLVQIALNSGFTAATTRNSYVDIGIGPDSANVTPIVEKLCGTGATTNTGHVYLLPLRIPPNVKLWARHQNTVASATIKLILTVLGGNMNPGTFPTCSKIVAIGAGASTNGTAIGMGASGAEGSWHPVIDPSIEDYAGFLVSGPFVVDTNMTAGPSYTFGVGVGASGQEVSIAPNLTVATIFSASEDWVAWHMPSFVGVPAGQRLAIRGSCSGVAESTVSVILLGMIH